jgi:hypothetical protein
MNNNDLMGVFYDLVLKKSLSVGFRSIECYLELSNQGKELIITTALIQNRPGLVKKILTELPYFKSQNCLIDSKTRQIILVKKFDFSQMSPDIFSLKLLQFHSEVMKYRNEIRDIDQGEKVLIPR